VNRLLLPADPDQKLRDLCKKGVADGWSCFKIKVGRDIDDDIRRCTIIREEIGWQRRMMVDANQVWDVEEAIAWMTKLAQFKPWFIEEPTAPGENSHCNNVYPINSFVR
jgi:L-fuconate dehydratase